MLTTMDAIAFNLRLTYGVIEMQLIRNVSAMVFLVSLMLLRRERFVPWFGGAGIAVFRGITIVPIGFLFFSSFAARPGLGDGVDFHLPADADRAGDGVSGRAGRSGAGARC